MSPKASFLSHSLFHSLNPRILCFRSASHFRSMGIGISDISHKFSYKFLLCMIIVSVVGIRFLSSLHHPSHSLPFVAFNLNRVFYDDYRISFGILNIVSLFDIPQKYSAFVFGFAGSKWEIMWILINKWYSRLTFNFDFWFNRLLANLVRKKVPFLLCIYSFIHFNIVGTISARTFDRISFRYVIY